MSAKARARRLAVEPAAQHLHADLELALADPAPREVEQLLVVARAVEHRVEFGGERPRSGGSGSKKLGRQHGVEQAGPARDLRRPGAARRP